MKEKIIELRKNGLNYNEISNKLKCSKSTVSYHCSKIPTQKEFSISKNKNRKFEDLKIELDKCILVCSNCHGEIHDNIIKMPM